MKAYRQLARYRGESGFRPWLLAIVANETRNLHRTRRRRDSLVLRVAARHGPEATGTDPADSAVARDRRRRLLDEIRRLSPLDREVLVCRYLLDLSEADTAITLGVPKGTVKSRTARALDKLRARVTPAIAGEVPGV